MIKTILWDIDGTLLDFLLAEKAAIKACFKKFHLGECTDQMIARYSQINVGYWKRLEKGEMTKPQILVGRFKDFFGEYNIDQSKAEAFNAEYQIRLGDTTVFTQGAKETVTFLKGKVLQVAVTNGTKVAQDRKLKNSGLDKLFDYVFISEDTGFEKPDPRFFDIVFKTISQSPANEPGITDQNPNSTEDKSQILIVGDSLTSDIAGGKNAEIKTCWYNPKREPLPQGVSAPDYEITRIEEVLSLI